jgi:hypothetical protein
VLRDRQTDTHTRHRRDGNARAVPDPGLGYVLCAQHRHLHQELDAHQL